MGGFTCRICDEILGQCTCSCERAKSLVESDAIDTEDLSRFCLCIIFPVAFEGKVGPAESE